MKVKVAYDSPEVMTVLADLDYTEGDVRQAVGIEGAYHKRANGLWIILKA